MTGRSGVTETLTAKHFDPLMGEGWHEHTWTVIAWYSSEPFRDMRSQKAALRQLLAALPNGNGEMPPELWSGEAIARSVLVLANTIGATVTRPEGYIAEVWL